MTPRRRIAASLCVLLGLLVLLPSPLLFAQQPPIPPFGPQGPMLPGGPQGPTLPGGPQGPTRPGGPQVPTQPGGPQAPVPPRGPQMQPQPGPAQGPFPGGPQAPMPPNAPQLPGARQGPTPPMTGPEPEGDAAPDESGGLGGLLPDPKKWAAHVFNQVLVNLLQGISKALREAVKGVLDSSLNFITKTPPDGSYETSTVKTLWGVVRGFANAALAVVALWGAFNLMVKEHIGSAYPDAMELFPRIALGALLANTSLSWAQLAININNVLCEAVGQTSLPSWDQADTVVHHHMVGKTSKLFGAEMRLKGMNISSNEIAFGIVTSPGRLNGLDFAQEPGYATLN